MKKFILTISVFAIAIVMSMPMIQIKVKAASYSVVLDRTYLGVAAVSEKAIPLSAKAYDSDTLIKKEIKFTITDGESVAKIEGENQLYVKSEGEFTVRASLTENPAIFDEEKVTAKKLNLKEVKFANDFSKINLYSQPFRLNMIYESNIYNEAYLVFNYEVTEGNARIFCDDFLQIKGVGKVVIKATSVYSSETIIIKEFNIVDPDAKVANEGCNSSINGGKLAILSCLTTLIAIVLIKVKGKKNV